jgi:DNA-binding PadR family transcriptional regulator
MNLSRLLVLGLLASHGPRHGHQIRRDAEQTNVGAWGGVSVGALYRELRRMEEEGLVDPLRTEQVGRRPARTIYQITLEGRRELHIQREQALLHLFHGADALGVALVFGRVGDRDELIELMQARRKILNTAREGVSAKCAHLQARGYLGPLDVAVFRRRELQLEAELKWHDEFDRVLAELPAETTPATEPKTRRKTDDRSARTGPDIPDTKGARRGGPRR